MSFDIDRAFDVGVQESKRRRKKSFNPDFTGDIDLDKLSKGQPFPTSDVFGASQTKRNLLRQRGRVERTPTRLKAEGNLEDAFLTNPLAAPSIDPTRKSDGSRKNGVRRNNVAKGRKGLLTERERLRRGGRPRTARQSEFEFENIRSLGF